ncbi:MAG: symmetrical bis(5'-nucleosyl)-tetraphosphatase [Zoogloeaceae bacterium]|jgi:bis(5'-nucleosyl)-tetraphosphatase (symmetrical)|nr:symmetrical bis(5'-nucleosyl)-tetraphosphatase [Zoogloeaceae bacterium]
MAIYAIGDIQGCFDEFLRLLDKCAFDPKQDQLWLTGDLVNRGPRSLDALRYVKSLGESAITVLGNHDLYLLMIAYVSGARRAKDDTLREIMDAPDREELLTWLRHCPLCHTEDVYCLVHAGLLPRWSVKKARALAAEVEGRLRGEDFREFLGMLWGSKPNTWSEDLTGIDRLRVIVNAMTRMRFCTAKGAMEFSAKGPPEFAPDGFLPWFDAPERKSVRQVLVVGHWSALGLKITPNLLALDTGCLWGGALTAVRLQDRAVFQVEGAKTRVSAKK